MMLVGPKYLTVAAGPGAHRLVPAPLSLTYDPDLNVSTLLARLALDSEFLRCLNTTQLALMASRGELEELPRGATLAAVGANGDIAVVLEGQLELRAQSGANAYGVALPGTLIAEHCTGSANEDVLLLRVDAELLAELSRPGCFC